MIAPLESILQAVLQLRIARHAILPLLPALLCPAVIVVPVVIPQGGLLLYLARRVYLLIHAATALRVNTRLEGRSSRSAPVCTVVEDLWVNAKLEGGRAPVRGRRLSIA